MGSLGKAALLFGFCSATPPNQFSASEPDDWDKFYDVPADTTLATCDSATLVRNGTSEAFGSIPANLDPTDCCFFWGPWQPCQNPDSGDFHITCRKFNRTGYALASTANNRMTRNATILRQPTQGGRPCPSDTTESKPCEDGTGAELPKCGIDCEYSPDWNDWTTCSTACGGGQQFRTRKWHKAPIDGNANNKGARCEMSQLRQERNCNTWNCQIETNQSNLCRLAAAGDALYPACEPQTSWSQSCVDQDTFNACAASGSSTSDFVNCKGERNVPYVNVSSGQERICTDVGFVHQSCPLDICSKTAHSYGIKGSPSSSPPDATSYNWGSGEQIGTICGGYESLVGLDIYDERTSNETSRKFLYMKVDTSKCDYESTPAYVVSMVDKVGLSSSFKSASSSSGITFFRVGQMSANSFTLILETDLLTAETAKAFFQAEETRISWVADSSQYSGSTNPAQWEDHPNTTRFPAGRSVCLNVSEVFSKQNNNLNAVATVVNLYNKEVPRPRTQQSVHFNTLRNVGGYWQGSVRNASSTWNNYSGIFNWTEDEQYSITGPLIDAHSTFSHGGDRFYCVFGTDLSKDNNGLGVSFVNVYDSDIGGKKAVTTDSTVVDDIDYASVPVIVSSVEFSSIDSSPFRGAGTVRNVSKHGFEAITNHEGGVQWYNGGDGYDFSFLNGPSNGNVEVNYILAGLDCDHGANLHDSMAIPDGATWLDGGYTVPEYDPQLATDMTNADYLFCEDAADDRCETCTKLERHYGDSYVTTAEDSDRPIYHLNAAFLDKVNIVGNKIFADQNTWVQAQFLQQDQQASRYAGGVRTTTAKVETQQGSERANSLWLDSGSRLCVSSRMSTRNANVSLPAVPYKSGNFIDTSQVGSWVVQPVQFKPIRGWCQHKIEMACPVTEICDNNNCSFTKTDGQCYGKCGTGSSGGLRSFDITINKPPVRLLQSEINEYPLEVRNLLNTYNTQGTECPTIIHDVEKCAVPADRCQNNSRPWVMSAWLDGTCNATCGGGFKEMTRTVLQTGRSHVKPATSKTVVCNTQPCPINCTVNTANYNNVHWTKCQGWTQCGKMDGWRIGHRDHTPAQYGGTECDPAHLVVKVQCEIPCPTYQCQAVPGSASNSSCSRTCGTGHLVRTQEQEPSAPLINGAPADMQELVTQDDTWRAINWTNGAIGQKWWEHFWPGTKGLRVCPNETTTHECNVATCTTMDDKSGTSKAITLDGKCTVTAWTNWTCDRKCEATFERRTRTASPPHCNSTEEIRDSCSEDARYSLPCEKNCTFDKWTKWTPVERTSVYNVGYISNDTEHLANVQRTRNVVSTGIDSTGQEVSGDSCGQLEQKVVWSCEAMMLLNNVNGDQYTAPTLNSDGIYDVGGYKCGCRNKNRTATSAGSNSLTCGDHGFEGFRHVEYYEVYCDFLAATETTTKWKESVPC